MFPKSWLFTPGNRPDRFGKALASGANGVILDLEDAVAPDDKDEARKAVAAFLSGGQTRQGSSIAVRINPLDTPSGLADLVALLKAGSGPDYVLLPKAEIAAELSLLGRILGGFGAAAHIIALVETARGVADAAALACASPRLSALMFGAADYAADLGRRASGFRPDFARAAIVNAAAAGRIAAIDSPFFDIADPDGLTKECQSNANLGFHGKAAIHPSQIGTISESFTVRDEDRDLAMRYLNASVDGVSLIDGKMVDEAMLSWARRIVS